MRIARGRRGESVGLWLVAPAVFRAFGEAFVTFVDVELVARFFCLGFAAIADFVSEAQESGADGFS